MVPIKQIMIPRKVCSRLFLVFLFVFSFLTLGSVTNWYYTEEVVHRERYIRVPGFVVASRNSLIPLDTPIHVDSPREVLLDIIKLAKDKKILPGNSSTDSATNQGQISSKLSDVSAVKAGPNKDRPHLLLSYDRKDGSTAGSSVNVNIWDEICGDDLESLKNYPLFPQLPSRKLLLDNNLKLPKYGKNIGLMVIGFMVPKCGGYHIFELICGAGNGELRISANEKPSEVMLISSTLSKTAKELYLQKDNRYYFEVLYKIGQHATSLEVKISHQDQFCTGKDLIFFQPLFPLERVLSKEVLELGLEWKRDFNSSPVAKTDNVVLNRKNMHSLPYFDEKDLLNLLPSCICESKYLVNRTLNEYDGVWETQYSSVFPPDNTNITEILRSGNTQTIFGNDLLEEEEAVETANSVMENIEKSHPG